MSRFQSARLLIAVGSIANLKSLKIGYTDEKDRSANGADLQEIFLEEQEASRRLAPPHWLLMSLSSIAYFLCLIQKSIISREESREWYVAAEEHITCCKLGIS